MELDQRSNDQVRGLLGERLRAFRKSRGLTQTELADRAGLSRPTVSALERGHDVSLDSFLSVLRALDLLEALNVTVPEPGVSPMDALTNERRRSTGDVSSSPAQWVWGDQA